jgi:hypothetical protein
VGGDAETETVSEELTLTSTTLETLLYDDTPESLTTAQ